MREIPLPLSKTVIEGEIRGCHWILDKWQVRLEKEGIPNDEEQLARFLVEFLGELSIVSRRCETLVDLLTPGP